MDSLTTPGFHGGPLPTSAVMGLISHTMEGNLSHTDDLFTPGPLGNGNSAHFGTAQMAPSFSGCR